MADMTKAEMVALLDQVEEKLTDALDPILSREEVIEKVQEVVELVEDDDDDDEGDEGDEPD